MAYTKTTWVNEGPPAIDADNLNKIEDGVFQADQRLNSIADFITERGTSNGWTYEKWNSGKMVAEKDITTGDTWTSVASPINHNTTAITPPAGMTVTGGYANLKSTSAYIVGAQVQVATGINLEVHRLASSSASFNFRVTLIGTY